MSAKRPSPDSGSVAALRAELAEARQELAACRKLREKYEELVQNANSIILRMDTEGVLTFFNEFAQRFFGFGEAEILGRNVVGTIVPETDTSGRDLEEMIKDIGRRPERYANNENENMRKNGDRVWVAWTNKAVLDPDGRITEILCVGNDITDHRRAEQALRESEAVLAKAQQLAHMGSWEWDLREDAFGMSDGLRRLYGIPKEDPPRTTGEVIRALIHPEDREAVRERTARARAERGGDPFTYRIVRPDGETRWMAATAPDVMRLEEDGRPRVLVGVVQDVTERKQAEEEVRRLTADLERRVAERTAELESANRALKNEMAERERAQAALRESEANYRQLAESITDVFFAMDAELRYTYWNKACEAYTGIAAEKALGRAVRELFPRAAGAEAERVYKAILETQRAQVVTGEYAHGRDVYQFEVRVYPSKTGLSVLARDITERRKAEAALRVSEERYRRVVEDQTELICRYLPDTTLTFVNAAYCRYFGKEPDELVGRRFASLIPEEDRADDEGHIASLSREDPMGAITHRVVTPDHGVRWVRWVNRMIFDERGDFVEYQAVGRDVTEEREANERVERQAAILAQVTDGVAVAREDGTVTHWNRGAEQMFGHAEAEMVGEVSLGRLLRPEYDVEELRLEILEALRTRGVWSHPRLPCRHRDGREMWVSVKASALERAPRGPLSVVLVARDVTGEIRLQERLIRAERLATIGTLAAGVGHELNNLLGGLHGLADLAARNARHVPRLVDTCRAVAERGGDIAGRLTTFAHADEPREDRELHVPDVVRTVVAMTAPIFKQRGIVVEEEYGRTQATWANEGKILQVLLNLFLNACDSIDTDGTVDVSVRHDRETDAIRVVVNDTGAGIRSTDLPRLFEPFFTTKREGDVPDGKRTRLGLGLAESLAIVEEYGGSIDVESEPGRGATFTVTLPVRSAPTAELRPVPAAARPDQGTAMLVVDDDPLMRFWLTEHLEAEGYEVAAVDRGHDAVELCRERTFPYVFLDLLMPGELGGIAALRKLREESPDSKVILITALGKAQTPEECLAAAHAVLQKPFGVDDVMRAFAGESKTR